MGKRREFDLDSTDNSPSPPKRHKKHKKHKRQKVDYDSEPVDVVNDIPEAPIRDLQGDLEKSKMLNSSSSVKVTPPSGRSQKKRRTKGKESETSSDEERWLDAIESGKLEEVDDELKKIKDPKLMTARQRAMYERGNDKEPSPGGEILMSLPTGYKEKVMTAEAIHKAQLKSQKRKQLADEKREKDKKKTMERLLKKQDTKSGKQTKSKGVKVVQPMITYKNTLDGATIYLPPPHEYPLEPQLPRDPPKPALCSMPGCTNLKVYNCSRTKVPLCSFTCYKRNVASIRDIIC